MPNKPATQSKRPAAQSSKPASAHLGKVQGDIPLHIKISEMLIREIRAGLLAPNERLPPEREMAQRLDISVGTLRKALSDLESKGMLLRKQGSGNYVQNNSKTDNVYALFRLELIKGGGLPTADVLTVKTLKKIRSLPEFGQSTQAHRFRRLRKLNDLNVAFEEIWLDSSYTDFIDKDSLPESLYLYYKEHLGFWITKVEDRVGVATLPSWASADLLDNTVTHFGYIERLSRDNSGNIAEYSRTWFNPNTTRFVAR